MAVEERLLAPAGPAWRRIGQGVGILAGGLLGVAILAVIGYAIATTPKAIPGRPPLTAFDPEQVGRQEQRAWQAYYLHQWPQLFNLMLRMTRSAFGLSLPQAVYASYLNTQAQVVWSRQGAADGLAEAYMLTFYEYIREPVGGQYDPKKAARLEVHW